MRELHKQRADKSSANAEPKASLLDELDEVNRSEAELDEVNVPERSVQTLWGNGTCFAFALIMLLLF